MTLETEKTLHYFTYRETPSDMFNAAQPHLHPFPEALPL